MAEPAPAERNASASFVGLVLISIGVLWLALTGLCTAVAFATLAQQGNLGDSMWVLVFAAPSAILGGSLYLVGRLLRAKHDA